MKIDDDSLWIFFHLPKTAGCTFRNHIEKNFKKEEILRFDRSERPWIETEENILSHDQLLKRYLQSLSKEKKAAVKIIYGHFISFGVHKYFNKPAKYVTFLRSPVERTISIYNYLIDGHKGLAHLFGNQKLWSENILLINNKIPAFEEWLNLKYTCTLPQMTQILCSLGYVDSLPKNNRLFEKALQKFYFIGTTENYEEDILFLCHEMRIRKFYNNQNISTKHFTLKDDPCLLKNIQEKNKLDIELYKHALEVSKQFKANTKNFYNIVRSMKVKKRVNLPFSEAMQILYRISAKMRRSSMTYSKSIDTLKKLCRI